LYFNRKGTETNTCISSRLLSPTTVKSLTVIHCLVTCC